MNHARLFPNNILPVLIACALTLFLACATPPPKKGIDPKRLRMWREKTESLTTDSYKILKAIHEPGAFDPDKHLSRSSRRFAESPDLLKALKRLPLASPDQDSKFRVTGSSVQDQIISSTSIHNLETGKRVARMRLRHNGGSWKLCAVKLYHDSEELTVDLEHPRLNQTALAMAFTPGFEQEIQANPTEAERHFMDRRNDLRAIKSVNREQFEKLWQIDVNLENEPAGVALEKILSEWGLGLRVFPEAKAALRKPVSVDLKKVSRFQAIEAICQQIDAHPIYDRGPRVFLHGAPYTLGGRTLDVAPSAIRISDPPPGARGGCMMLAAGPRSLPAVCAGPFLVRVIKLQERAPQGLGMLQYELVLAGIPRAVMDTDPRISLPEILSMPDGMRVSTGQVSGDNTSVSANREISRFKRGAHLKKLHRHVDTIRVYNTRVTVSLPAEEIRFEFNPPAEGFAMVNGIRSVTIEQEGFTTPSKESYQIRFRVSGMAANKLAYLGYDENGNLLKAKTISDGGAAQTLEYLGKPVKLVARKREDNGSVSYPFNLGELSLKRFKEQLPKKSAAKGD